MPGPHGREPLTRRKLCLRCVGLCIVTISGGIFVALNVNLIPKLRQRNQRNRHRQDARSLPRHGLPVPHLGDTKADLGEPGKRGPKRARQKPSVPGFDLTTIRQRVLTDGFGHSEPISTPLPCPGQKRAFLTQRPRPTSSGSLPVMLGCRPALGRPHLGHGAAAASW